MQYLDQRTTRALLEVPSALHTTCDCGWQSWGRFFRVGWPPYGTEFVTRTEPHSPSTFGGCSPCARSPAVTFEQGPETSGLAFFGEHELPAELSTRWVLLPQIQRMLDHMRHPELPTEFD
jgi:hypothetical protein